MADKYQYQNPGTRRTREDLRQDWRDREDEDRDFGYGRYADTDEGDSSVRAGSYDQGRAQFQRERDPNEQRGNYGRAGYSGQGHYGQTGYGRGGYGQGRHGQPSYGFERERDREREFGGGRYSQGTFGTERSGWREQGGWNEPYGEGQQYTTRGDYPSGSSEYGHGVRGMGQHRGKGPKGYQRSDERLKEMICERLREDPDIDPGDVTITVTGGRITLEGTVDSRHTKNAIEDIADQFGVQDVQNNLRVQRTAQFGGESTASRAGTTGTAEGTKPKQH